MRFSALLPAFILFVSTLALSTTAQANRRTAKLPAKTVHAIARLTPRKIVVKMPKADKLAIGLLRKGRVSTLAGPLAGAVVSLAGSDQMTVTNANGEFQLQAQTGCGPLQATITYAGFADETAILVPGGELTTVRMTTEKPVNVAKKYQLKAYEKTARKEVQRSLRQVRKEKFTV